MTNEVVYCPGCGAKLTANTNFCYKCGTNISKFINEIKDKETIKCPNCGALNPLDTNVCLKCWSKIDSETDVSSNIEPEIKGARKVTYSVSYEESENNMNKSQTTTPDNKISYSQSPPQKPIELMGTNFDEEVLNSTKPVIVEFWATWCGPCNALAPIIDEVARDHPEWKVGKLDVDRSMNIAQKYAIRSIPLIAIFKEGKIYDTIVGFIPKEELVKRIKSNV